MVRDPEGERVVLRQIFLAFLYHKSLPNMVKCMCRDVLRLSPCVQLVAKVTLDKTVATARASQVRLYTRFDFKNWALVRPSFFLLEGMWPNK